MCIRPLDIVLKIIEVLFLSQKHFILFPKDWILFNDLSVSSLTQSSIVSNALLVPGTLCSVADGSDIGAAPLLPTG